MRIDPLKQVATVESQQGTQAQKKAVYDYNQDRTRPAKASSSRRASYHATPTTRRRRLTKTPRATTSPTRRSPTPRNSSSPITTSAPPLPALWAISLSTSATTSLPPPCSPPWTRTPTSRLTSTSPPSVPALVRQGLPVEILDTAGNDPRQIEDRLRLSTGGQRPAEHSRQGRHSAYGRTCCAISSSSRRALPGAPLLRRRFRCSPSASSAARPSSTLRRLRATATSLTRYRSRLARLSATPIPFLAVSRPGDKVIVSGLQFLQEGAPVKPLG